MSKNFQHRTHNDTLWLAYVSTAPGLSELDKRRSARAVQRMRQAVRAQELRRKACEWAVRAALCALGAVLFALMLTTC